MFRDKLQLATPTTELLGDDDDASDARGLRRRADPDLPGHGQARSPGRSQARVAHRRSTCLPDDVARPAAGRACAPRRGLLGLDDALRAGPPARQPRRRTPRPQERLRFDEAFVLQVVLAQRRAALRRRAAGARAPAATGGLLDRVRRAAAVRAHRRASRRSASAIADDLAARHPMHRLLQGEVGSGKTVVALRAMLRSSTPAARRRCSRRPRCSPSSTTARSPRCSATSPSGGMLGGADDGTRVALLTGSHGDRRPPRRRCSTSVSGEAGIVIGTHALLEDKVAVRRPRPGRRRRAAPLRRRAARRPARPRATAPPHVLVMTATPIPRTVAMTVFGDLEISTLTELPAGRVADRRRTSCRAAEQAALARPGLGSGSARRSRKGHQAYVVCPRIGDDAGRRGGRRRAGRRRETTSAPRPPLAVLDVAPMLADGPLAGLRVEMLHGRLPPDEKDDVMRRVRRRRDRRAGLDHGHRGRRRRRQRDRDGGPRRRPVRRLPAPPAARPGRPRRPRPGCACWSPTRRAGSAGPRAARRGGRHHRRLRALPARPRAAPRGRRARRLASPGGAPACGCCSVLARRGRHRRGPRGRGRAGRRRTPTSPGTRRCARAVEPAARRPSRPTTWRRHDPDRSRGAAGGRRLAGARRATAPGRPPTGCARRCSPPSSRCSARWAGLRVLDLYAGSGAVGLEALSRGRRRTPCWSSPTARGAAR